MQKFSQLFPQGVLITQPLNLKEKPDSEDPVYDGLKTNVR